MPTTTSVNLDTGKIAAHIDVAANDVATVNFTTARDGQPNITSRPAIIREIEVIVVSSTAPVFYTTDGTAPTVRGHGCFIVPTALAADRRLPASYRPVVVKVISAAAAVVSIQAVR